MNEAVKRILKNDPITGAVDECNKILEPLGLEICDLTPTFTTNPFQKYYVRMQGGKLVHKNTAELIKQAEGKKIPSGGGDTRG